ncbi:MAG: Arm DNA-binding domain-containing protein [Thiolinea sp.]
MVGKTITLLTDLEVKNAEIKESSYKLKDMPGLLLQVNPSGSKIWRLRYRNPKTKQETMYTIGTFPQIKCAAARLAAIAPSDLKAKELNDCFCESSPVASALS